MQVYLTYVYVTQIDVFLPKTDTDHDWTAYQSNENLQAKEQQIVFCNGEDQSRRKITKVEGQHVALVMQKNRLRMIFTIWRDTEHYKARP